MKHSKAVRYVKVQDGRGKSIDGLWIRNGVYYVQLRLADATGQTKPVRKRLEATSTLAAKAEAESLRVQRNTGKAPPTKTPYVKDAVEAWLKVYAANHPIGSVRARRRAAKIWVEKLGNLKLNLVKPSRIRGIMAERTEDGFANNTIRSEYDVLNQVMSRAREDRAISENPCEFVKQPPKEDKDRKLYTAEDVRRFAEAQDTFKSYGARGRDLALLMAYSGVRIGEALRLKWDHEHFGKRVLRVREDFKTKGGYSREINFNPDLESLLKEMVERRLPDSDWLFASYHGVNRNAQKTPTSWAKAAKVTGLDIKPHDLRHFFVSRCDMSRIDYKTIAAWVGHKDPALTARVYAHLLDGDKEEMAALVNFGPRIVEAA